MTSTNDRGPSAARDAAAVDRYPRGRRRSLRGRRSGGDAAGRPHRRADHTAANGQRHPRPGRWRRRGPTGGPGSPMRRSTRRGLQGLRDAGVDQVVLREDLLTPTDLAFTLTRPALLDVRRRDRAEHDASSTAGSSQHFDEPERPGARGHASARRSLAALLRQPERRTRHRDRTARPTGSRLPRSSTRSSPVSRPRPCSRPVTIDDYFRTVPRAVDDAGHPVVRCPRRAVDGVARLVRRRARAHPSTSHRLRDDDRRGRSAARRRPSDGCSSRAPSDLDQRSPIGLPRRSRRRDQPANVVPPCARSAVGHAHARDTRRCRSRSAAPRRRRSACGCS